MPKKTIARTGSYDRASDNYKKMNLQHEDRPPRTNWKALAIKFQTELGFAEAEIYSLKVHLGWAKVARRQSVLSKLSSKK